MAKMWAGRTGGETAKIADDFNSSIHFDQRMFEEDITGSMAHATMLAAKNIITDAERDELLDGLEGILSDIKSGALGISEDAEDIHMFVEEVFTKRIGDTGKKLHTARSRNDQVALDIRLYLRKEMEGIVEETKKLVSVLCDKAEVYKDTICPGYTHL